MNDLDRILALPVVDLDAEAAAAMFTALYRPAPGPEDWRLKPAQAAALYWLTVCGGAVLPMGVGSGKTLVAHLAPKILGLDVDEVLVLVPAELRKQYANECRKYQAEGFAVEPLQVVSYSELSRADGLEKFGRPRLIILDEAHNLRNEKAKRTKNFKRYLKSRGREVRVVCMSATLTTSSVFDYAHLAEWALGGGSPLPLSYSRLAAWARILDSPAGGEASVGPQPGDWSQIKGLMDDPRFRPEGADELGAVECARAAFEARLSTTPGVVRTLEPSCDRDISWSFWKGPAPVEVARVYKEVDDSWVLPNGYEVEDTLRAAAKLKQVSQGFYYFWDWPGGVDGVDREWLSIRAEYGRELRRVIRNNRRGLDSVGDVERAIRAGDFYDEELRGAWADWQDALDGRAEPPETLAQWFDDSVLVRAVEEARAALAAGHNPIIWYSHRAVADRLETMVAAGGEFEVARGGEGVEGDRPALIASIASHGTGLNLQAFNWNLILCPPASGAQWEQLIGRTHRRGQPRDIHVRVFIHTRSLQSSWKSATVDAHYLHETQGVPCKLLTTEKK